jgi:hypothetical protein
MSRLRDLISGGVRQGERDSDEALVAELNLMEW